MHLSVWVCGNAASLEEMELDAEERKQVVESTGKAIELLKGSKKEHKKVKSVEHEKEAAVVNVDKRSKKTKKRERSPEPAKKPSSRKDASSSSSDSSLSNSSSSDSSSDVSSSVSSSSVEEVKPKKSKKKLLSISSRK